MSQRRPRQRSTRATGQSYVWNKANAGVHETLLWRGLAHAFAPFDGSLFKGDSPARKSNHLRFPRAFLVEDPVSCRCVNYDCNILQVPFERQRWRRSGRVCDKVVNEFGQVLEFWSWPRVLLT